MSDRPLTDDELAALMKAEADRKATGLDTDANRISGNARASLDRAMQSDPDIGRQPAGGDKGWRVWLRRWRF